MLPPKKEKKNLRFNNLKFNNLKFKIMATRFDDLEVWKQSRGLCKDIYQVTYYDLFNKDFRFRDQIRASAGSIMDNIAEEFENFKF
jgi:hypothetical protein